MLFATRAFNIVPIAPNAVQYIQSIFLTTDGSNVPGSERITLDGTNGNGYFAGKVGIGTATPASKLHLLDSNSTTLTLQCLDGDCNNRINFIEDGTT